MPMLTKKTVRRDNGKARKSVVCVFPGYLAVVNGERNHQALRRSRKLVRLLPVKAQENFVRELSNVQRVLEHVGKPELHSGLVRRKRVVIVSGPLQGIEGLIEGGDSSRVFLGPIRSG